MADDHMLNSGCRLNNLVPLAQMNVVLVIILYARAIVQQLCSSQIHSFYGVTVSHEDMLISLFETRISMTFSSKLVATSSEPTTRQARKMQV